VEFGDEDSDIEEPVVSNGEMRNDTSATQVNVLETTIVLKNPSRKPWSFSDVEDLPQNNVPWGEPSQEIMVETPIDVHNPASDIYGGPGANTDNERPGSLSTPKISEPYASNGNLMAGAKYRCFRCKQYKIGVRFVLTQEHRGTSRVFAFRLRRATADNPLPRQTIVPVVRSDTVSKIREGYITRLSSPPLEMLNPTCCRAAEYDPLGTCYAHCSQRHRRRCH
jgi:hypothetical protein